MSIFAMKGVQSVQNASIECKGKIHWKFNATSYNSQNDHQIKKKKKTGWEDNLMRVKVSNFVVTKLNCKVFFPNKR